MKEDEIKEELFKNFKKWHKNNNWYNPVKMTSEQVKRYLGYFGINRR